MTRQTTQIAKLINSVRRDQGITQAEFASRLGTSQSAIARIESGKQNLSLEMLFRISEALGREIISLSDGSVNFRINGGKKLSGTIETKASKNAAVVLLAASLLNKGTTRLKRMPNIEEVKRLVEVLRSIGVDVTQKGDTMVLKRPAKLKLDKINKQSARKTRSILLFLGPLLHMSGDFKLPFAGGCKLGERSVRPHLYGLEAFGVTVNTTTGNYHVKTRRKQPGEVILYESGDTVTENVIMAAALTPGATTIKFASPNYMVQDLCFFLEKLGVKIDGIGTSTVTIHGVKEINEDITYYPSEDPIEAMMFVSLAATTKSEITIARAPIDFLELELLRLEKMGLKYNTTEPYKARNNRTKLVDITVKPSELKAAEDKVHPMPFPGINIDNLPFFAPIAAVAKGTTLIHDWVYENRAIYFTELSKLGVQLELMDPHRIAIKGPTRFKPADLVCPPALRPAAIILIAMLAAEGPSMLRNVYSINRGYEDLVSRLREIGADITTV